MTEVKTGVEETSSEVLNVNVGILGHVDSGKTSLAKAISSLLSTAALDKHPQSRERGITLDLGFSAFQVEMPTQLKMHPCSRLQFTLVDCPGHASLIRTIIGGAQIIDIMLLVIDVTKGIQTQTAECLVVGEISQAKALVVVLNKTDLLAETTREAQVEKMTKKLRVTLRGTRFSAATFVATAARPGGSDGEQSGVAAQGIDRLKEELSRQVHRLARNTSAPLLLAIDHCFGIRGQGTVMTGTLLQGRLEVGQVLELPLLQMQRKVKSIQMFGCTVASAAAGDRVGVCVSQLDPSLLERGLAAAPGTVTIARALLALVKPVRYFRGRAASKMRFHVTAGHCTVMAEVLFFGAVPGSEIPLAPSFDDQIDHQFQEELPGTKGSQEDCATTDEQHACWALLTLDSAIPFYNGALLIASRLDASLFSNDCRLAFHGRMASPINPAEKGSLLNLRIYKIKHREGSIERFMDARTAVCKGLFKKETSIEPFLGLHVSTTAGRTGIITSSFGKSGKFKVLFEEANQVDQEPGKPSSNKITLEFKRYMFDPSKRMVQS